MMARWLQYYWAVSDWGACSAACNGGTQTRTIACMDALDGLCVMPFHASQRSYCAEVQTLRMPVPSEAFCKGSMSGGKPCS